MKQAEKVLGLLIILLMGIRLYYSYPFSALLITLLTLLLSMMYSVLSFGLLNGIRFRNLFKKESFKGISTLRIIGTIFTGLILSIVMIGVLFKFQRWPFAYQNLIFGLSALLVVLSIVLVKLFSSKNKFYTNNLLRLSIIGFFGMVLYCFPSEILLEMKNRNFPEYVEAEKKLMKDPENAVLQQNVREEREKMHLVK